MKIKKLTLYIILMCTFFGCAKDNENILLPCGHEPLKVNNVNWSSTLALNNLYISKAIIQDDEVIMFGRLGQKEKLVIYNKSSKITRSFDLQNYYGATLYKEYIYEAVFNDIEGNSLIRTNIRTGQSETLKKETKGYRISKLQIVDGKLFYLLSHIESLKTRVYSLDIKNPFVTTEIHTNSNWTQQELPGKMHIWKHVGNSYYISYIYNYKKFQMVCYKQDEDKPLYNLEYNNESGHEVFSSLGFYQDLYLSFVEFGRTTQVFDLVTGKLKFTFPDKLEPMSPQYSKSETHLVSAKEGILKYSEPENNKIYHVQNDYLYTLATDSNEPPSISCINLSSKCVEYSYDINFLDFKLFDGINNEVIVIRDKTNIIEGYRLQ
jgi:hypothetical protein